MKFSVNSQFIQHGNNNHRLNNAFVSQVKMKFKINIKNYDKITDEGRMFGLMMV